MYIIAWWWIQRPQKENNGKALQNPRCWTNLKLIIQSVADDTARQYKYIGT